MNNTIIKGIEILKLIAQSKKALNITEITKITNIPKTTVHNLVKTFEQTGFLELENNQLKSYKLGILSFEIGINYVNSLDIYTISKPILQELSNKTSNSSFLVKRLDNEIIYINKVEANKRIIATSDIGTRMPLYTSSMGKSILSTFSEEELENYFNNVKLIKKTPYTIDSKEKLLEQLEEGRKKGYFTANYENEDKLYCIGSPVFNHHNECVAAIGISLISFDKDTMKNKDIFAEYVKESAYELSKKLGYKK